MKKQIGIIIPTFNNPDFLNPCVSSIIRTTVLQSEAELIIVNNGKQDIERNFGGYPGIKIINSGENLGWEKGLELGMKHTDAPFLVFQNDDTFIPIHQLLMYRRLHSRFSDDNVGAVAPVTTTAAGLQSIYHPSTPIGPMIAPYLIFYTVMIRREALEKIGGIDTGLPGGDDLDMSIRLRDAGYKIMIDPYSFIIHHGFKTGERVNGGAGTKGGWNSPEMTERTNKHLIRKHGFKKFINTLHVQYEQDRLAWPDIEGNWIRSHINGHKNIVELGVGGSKTIPNAVGIDRVNKGEDIPFVEGQKSMADVVADVTEKIPLEDNTQDLVIARHILEHCVDTVKTVTEWKRLLKMGAEMIIAVPDERVGRSIPLNCEHVHAFTPDSLKSFMEMLGMEQVKSQKMENNTSFVSIFRKVR